MSAHRILLYGASNLWLSRRAALTQLRKRFPGHLEIGLAHGPGRSYGLRAGNPFMKYVPLKSVEFDFEGDVTGERLAFLTDIGNDIVYAQQPDRILGWITDLARRLEDDAYQVTIGGVPRESVARIGPRLFGLLARCYYPNHPLSPEQVNRNLDEVEDGVRELCRTRGYGHFELNPEWYSYDHFHLKRRARDDYWETVLGAFPVRQSYDSRWSFRIRRAVFPQRFWSFGRERQGRAFYQNLVPHSETKVR